MLLCAHLDTVPLQAPVEPVLSDGAWENANEGILGADNKAAVAVLLALARHVRREGAPVDLELLFTVGEERSLAGAQRVRRGAPAQRLRLRLRPRLADRGGGRATRPRTSACEASFRGAAAHAGIRPEDGRSAILAAARAIASMRLGRVDEEHDGQRGHDRGGSAINVVPEALLGAARGAQPRATSARRRSWRRSSTACTRRPTCPTATATWT